MALEKRFIFGLGNPDRKHQVTRHNAGVMAIEALAVARKLEFTDRNGSRCAEFDYEGRRIYLLASSDWYMNESGQLLLEWKRREGLAPENLLVVFDDMDLPLGKLRIRPLGSGGSHNGMASILADLGSEQFARLRLGVDKPVLPEEWANYVLQDFRKDEIDVVKVMLAKAGDAILDWAKGENFEKLMSQYNA